MDKYKDYKLNWRKKNTYRVAIVFDIRKDKDIIEHIQIMKKEKNNNKRGGMSEYLRKLIEEDMCYMSQEEKI